MANYYYSETGGFNWYKRIRPNAFLCVTFFSDSDLPEITFPDSMPGDVREVVEANFEFKFHAAMAKIKEAKDE